MEKYEQVLVSLRRIMRAVDLHSRQLVRLTGLTAPQLLALRTLAANGELTAGAIARAVQLSQATITAVLDRLEEAGLVVRVRSERDRRQVLVRLTDAGRKACRAAPMLLQEHFVARYQELSQTQQAALLDALQQVARMMDADDIDAPPLLDTHHAEPARSADPQV